MPARKSSAVARDMKQRDKPRYAGSEVKTRFGKPGK